MTLTQIMIDTDVAYSRGRGGVLWPVTKYVVRVNGTWLSRKDGKRRMFNSREAARKAGQESLKTER